MQPLLSVRRVAQSRRHCTGCPSIADDFVPSMWPGHRIVPRNLALFGSPIWPQTFGTWGRAWISGPTNPHHMPVGVTLTRNGFAQIQIQFIAVCAAGSSYGNPGSHDTCPFRDTKSAIEGKNPCLVCQSCLRCVGCTGQSKRVSPNELRPSSGFLCQWNARRRRHYYLKAASSHR